MTLLLSEFLQLQKSMIEGLEAKGYKVYLSDDKLTIIDPKTDSVVTTLVVRVL